MAALPPRLPPTPSPSLHSPNSLQDIKSTMMEGEQPVAGPSQGWRSLPSDLPPTPPVYDGDSAPSSCINFSNPDLPTRRLQPTRRPLSAYPAQKEEIAYHPPHRKYTDPTPRTRRFDEQQETIERMQEVDVDMDAYSATEFDTDEGLDEREPTLSFVTTSTIDSTTSTPPMNVTYGYKSEADEGKPEIEPKVRMRTGRSHAYSSAESSMASGAYSYHAYSEQMYHPHPPPLPHLPSTFTSPVEHVGLGITSDFPLPPSQPDSRIDSPRSNPPLSPSHSFTHRPWRRDIVNRLRSDSASSSITTASTSTTDSGPSSSRIPPPNSTCDYTYDNLRLPWETEPKPDTAPEAIALVEEGREKLLDMAKIEAMGGIAMMTDDVISSLAGVTHLILPSCGPHILDFLPRLLAVLAPTLVVLDISSNDISILPNNLQYCTLLEELNASGNPLRQMASWLGELVALRVLVVDNCEIQSLPAEIANLHSMHTLCARRNKLVSLPPWLCLLGHLETLKVDENPFASEWAPIVAPILAARSQSSTRPNGPSRANSHHRHLSINDGLRSPPSMASMTSSFTASSLQMRDLPPATSSATIKGEQPWVSAPTSAAQSVYQLSGLGPIAEDHPHTAPLGRQVNEDRVPVFPPTLQPAASSQSGRLRKMRSAGALLGRINTPSQLSPTTSTTAIAPAASAVGVKAGNEIQSSMSKFASLGSNDGHRAASAMGDYIEHPASSTRLTAPGMSTSNSTKTGKWGFLRKMSMHRLKSDKDKSTNMTASASANLKSLPPPPPLQHLHSEPAYTMPTRPSMTGTRSAMTLPTRKEMDAGTTEFGQMESKSLSINTLPSGGLPASSSLNGNSGGTTPVRSKRRSFLPIDLGPPSINISIPSTSPFMPPLSDFESHGCLPIATSEATIADTTMPSSYSRSLVESPSSDLDPEARYAQGLESIKSYLRDLFDLSRPPIEPYGGFEVVGGADGSYAASSAPSEHPGSPMSANISKGSFVDVRRARRPTLDTQASRATSIADSEPGVDYPEPAMTGKKFKNDKNKRAKILREIYETERTYVRGLGELVSIYVRPAGHPVNPNKSNTETVVPSSERKIVFGGVESILSIHRDNFLPALEKAVKSLLEGTDDDEGSLSADTAHHVGEVFRTYIAYMKQYSTYINNFDNALSRMKTWTAPNSTPNTPAFSSKSTVPSVGVLATAAMGMSDSVSHSGAQLTTSQKKRVKAFLKRCKEHPLHSQINLESYLLLPIQRVPRYKLLLEDLAMCTPPRSDGMRDTLDDALNEIASLASLMNEEKREADSRMRLLSWQQRITKSGPSPLVQPHRRLVLEGALTLIRLVKKASTFVECESTLPVNSDGDLTITPGKVVVPVEYIKPELVDRQVMLVLCSDLMVLATQRGEGWEDMVDLFNVLRMATLREPASIVHGNVLRVVDNKSIYYFNGTSHDDTQQWCRAINSARRR
ncbi:hypothetical protein IAR55_002902 [Kwoniella newhampshirensis]|uniref:DH domain-containing protein n=1 Tax=Kwoniella newhampshirensis TaxID=1651941 RepID=A0AAW0YQ37_9TREE